MDIKRELDNAKKAIFKKAEEVKGIENGYLFLV
jgi:hypothetical protein